MIKHLTFLNIAYRLDCTLKFATSTIPEYASAVSVLLVNRNALEQEMNFRTSSTASSSTTNNCGYICRSNNWFVFFTTDNVT